MIFGRITIDFDNGNWLWVHLFHQKCITMLTIIDNNFLSFVCVYVCVCVCVLGGRVTMTWSLTTTYNNTYFYYILCKYGCCLILLTRSPDLPRYAIHSNQTRKFRSYLSYLHISRSAQPYNGCKIKHFLHFIWHHLYRRLFLSVKIVTFIGWNDPT